MPDTATWRVASPNGTISAVVILDQAGGLLYRALKGDAVVIPDTHVGITVSDADLSWGLVFDSAAETRITESYSLPGGGRKALYTNDCTELTLGFHKGSDHVKLVVRAYDDGVAYRFAIDGEGPAVVTSEVGGFGLPGGSKGWAMDWVCNYEAEYKPRSYGDLASSDANLMMPALLQTPEGAYLLITESCVDGSYCGSHLHGNPKGVLDLAWAEDQEGPIETAYPLATPWRVALIVDDLDSLVNSTTVYDLSPPSRIADTSWIKGGRAAWNWWADMPNTLETGRMLVDFAHSMGWEYVLMDAGWDEAWIGELVEYASRVGVGIWVWAHHTLLDTREKVDSILPGWAAYGIKGIKVDFFDSDNQATMEEYDRITDAAAGLRLMVNYHGATKPAGEERTWPHILTREGIMGAEYYKWSDGADAVHNCTVPFTRNVIGSMDYTPVTFSNNRGRTTWAHQAALAVVFESHVQHFADHPDWYRRCGALDFLREAPTGWDQTVLLEGRVGEFVTMARRAGNRWFIGGICTQAARTAAMDLSFLADGPYLARIWRDGGEPTGIVADETVVDASMTITVDMMPNGGFGMVLSRVEK